MQALCLTGKDAYLQRSPKRLGDFSHDLGSMSATTTQGSWKEKA